MLFIDIEHLYIGASPDGVIDCAICGKGVLEIKCPLCIKGVLPEEEEEIKDFGMTKGVDGAMDSEKGPCLLLSRANPASSVCG